MKNRIFTIIMIVFVIFITFFIQLYIVNPRDLFGVKPNLILITVIVVSMWYSAFASTIFGILIGVITDMIFGTQGIFLTSYTIISVVIGIFKEKYNKDNKFSLIYITLIASLGFEVIQYFEYAVIHNIYADIIYLFKQIVLSGILNITLVFIFYSLIYKIANRVEEDFVQDVSSF